MASKYCPAVMKRFLPHFWAHTPARIRMKSITNVLAVAIPPPSERVMDKVFEISGRQNCDQLDGCREMVHP